MNSLKIKIPKKTLDVQVTTVDAVLEFQIDVSASAALVQPRL